LQEVIGTAITAYAMIAEYMAEMRWGAMARILFQPTIQRSWPDSADEQLDHDKGTRRQIRWLRSALAASASPQGSTPTAIALSRPQLVQNPFH
jgi:hypothetical protein